MELTNVELKEVEVTVAQAEEKLASELNDLQLSFAGGGVGDVIVF